MKSQEIEKILKENGIKQDEYQYIQNISIKLKGGREIFPDWLHMRLNFSKNSLKIQYGHPESFGGRIIGEVSFSYDYKTLNIKEKNGKLEVNSITPFREPEFGDVVISSLNGAILSKSIIIKAEKEVNGIFRIVLSEPFVPEGRISFYDPKIKRDSYSCFGNIIEGHYIKMIPNKESISKKEVVHEIIKYQEITEICVNIDKK